MEFEPCSGSNFRTHHVDAISYWRPLPNYQLYHEVAVCYRFYDEVDDDFDVGVYRMRFRWEDMDPVTGIGDPFWTDNFIVPDPMEPCHDFFPDVAYDPYTSDLYLVWSRQMNYGVHPEPDAYRLHYMRFHRNTDMSGQWLGPWQAQPNSHNGWTPRIDVGTTEEMFGLPVGVNVVVGYSSQYANDHVGFHLRANGWIAGDDGDHNTWDLDLQNPSFPLVDAGLPSVDIAPETSETHYVAIGYIQNESLGGLEPEWGIHLWDTIGGVHDIFPDLPEDQFLYPAVAINYEEDSAVVSGFTE
ncbi:MAG TPA: hypothetical protein ENL37_01760 [Desulfobacteraceae bacterium]|nr:hypothetical protein [Desulfobacteraceae bacterium]